MRKWIIYHNWKKIDKYNICNFFLIMVNNGENDNNAENVNNAENGNVFFLNGEN